MQRPAIAKSRLRGDFGGTEAVDEVGELGIGGC